MKTALVSCIIPVFNGEAYLDEALDSVLAQTHPYLEVLVVDDGSTDASLDLAQSYAPVGVRLLQKENGGQASARNLGVKQAMGEFIAFLDADDLWLPEKLSRQLREFEANERLGFCTTYIQNFWAEALEQEARENGELARPQPGVASTLLVRRRTFQEVGPFDEKLVNRNIQEWIMRACLKGWERKVLKNILVRRRIHTGNLSRRRTPGENELLDIASALLARKRRN